MRKLAVALFPFICMMCSTAACAQNTNVRGTISAFDGKVISVKTRDGSDMQVDVPDAVTVLTTQALKLSDLKPGQPVAVTTVRRAADGATVAIDVRPLSATANLGLSAYDLQPESTMTNAALEGLVQSSAGYELILNYKTGTVKVLVPEGTPMSRSAPGERSDIKVGETVFIPARPAADGKLTALRVQVSKDGVKPTQ